MIVEQAIFGIKAGRGHGLIASTINKQLLESVRTDFLSTINPHSNWQPYYKTQVIADYFLFLKTYPDNEQDRKGSVFTHTLIVKKSEIHLLENLNDLFSLFKSKNKHTLPLKPIELQLTPFQKTENSLVKKVVHYLVHPKKYKNKPIIWLGKKAFLPMITELWSLLPAYTRQTFTFSYSIKPDDLFNDKYYILYSNQANHWTEYHTVTKEDKHESTTSAELFILSSQKKGEMSDFIDELDLKVYDFAKLQTAHKAAEHYKSLSTLDFQGTLLLLKRLTVLVPKANQGKSIKERVLSHLVKLIPNVDIDETIGLGNLKIISIANAKSIIQNALEIRFKNELSNTKNINALVELLKVFFEHFIDNHWWYKLIKAKLISFFKQENTSSSQLIWRLWKEDVQFINWLKLYIPNTPSIEQSLATEAPLSLSESLGNSIRNFTIKRNWLLLHGYVVTAYSSISKAFVLQLKVDTNTWHSDGLKIVAEKANPKELINAALNLNDKRLFILAGQACDKNIVLLKSIQLKNSHWQQIWLEKTKVNSKNNIWQGFDNPLATVYEILDILIAKKSFNTELLLKISESKNNNLLDYPNREKVWQILPIKAKSNFLSSTAQAWYEKLNTQTIDEDLEDELSNAINNTGYIKAFIGKSKSLQLILETFSRFKQLNESDLCEIIDKKISYKKIETTEAILLGKMVKHRNWHYAQKNIIRKFNTYNNLSFAIQEFENNLGFWSWCKLIKKGYSHQSFDINEWWQQFTNLMIELYPNGIKENNIWERAGGEFSNIRLNCSAREQWQVALRKLRYGGGGKKINTQELIWKVKFEYHKNQEIRILSDIYNKLK